MDPQEKLVRDLLERLRNFESGKTIEGLDLDFAVFFDSRRLIGFPVEQNEYRILRPLNIRVCNKDEKRVGYDVFSGETRFTLLNETDWEIGGGTIEQDNLTGNYYLKLGPLTNFASSEARLYPFVINRTLGINESKEEARRT